MNQEKDILKKTMEQEIQHNIKQIEDKQKSKINNQNLSLETIEQELIK